MSRLGRFFLVGVFLLSLGGVAWGDKIGVMVSEADGNPSKKFTPELKFPNGSLTVNADGSVTFSGAGTGDMLQATYDVAGNGKIDADKVDDLSASYLAITGGTLSGGLAVEHADGVSVGKAATTLGLIKLYNNTGGNSNAFSIFPGATGVGVGWRLPTAAPGGANYLLNVDADGTMDYTDPATLGSGILSDAAYGAGWDGDTTHAPSKNAVYDVISGLGGGHTQNTDTGTTSATFQLDSGNTGPKLKNSAGVFQVRNAADNAYAALEALTVTVAKQSGTAGDMALYEANSTDTHAAGFRGPASITGDGAYRMQLPNARASAANQVLAVTNSGESGTGTAADPYVQATSWITPMMEGTASGGLIFGDSSPDADGEIGFASHQATIHDGTAARDVLQVASTTFTKSEYMPIRYAEDGTTAPAAVAEIGTTTAVARSFAEDADNDVVFWWQVPLDYSAGIKYRVYYALNANAQANETAGFSLAGCSVANSEALACSPGTAVVVTDELSTDEDTGELIVSDWSTAVTVTGIAAGEMARLVFMRDVSEDDYSDHLLVIGIEIKYQAKLNASGDY